MDTTIKDFEAAIAELEAIVKKLEEGDLPLEKVAGALRARRDPLPVLPRRLEDAERRIEVLNERGDAQARVARARARCRDEEA